MTHRQRGPPGPHAPEPVTAALGLLQKLEVDLHLEDLLHAAHVGVPPRLVGVDERTGTLDACTRVDDLVAVNLAAAALHLVLRTEG